MMGRRRYDVRRLFTSLLVALLLVGCGQTNATPLDSSSTTMAVTTTTSMPPPDLTASTEPTTSSEVRSITVGGMGAEYAAPDRAIVNLAASSRGKDVASAAQAASSAGDAMVTAMTAAGVDAADIQTYEFSIEPYYVNYPEITGYEVRIGYRIIMSGVDRVGEILGEAVRAGGDEVRAWGLRFEVEPDGLMEVARTQAWADVESRAQALADLSGETLGPVLDIHEKVLLSNSSGMIQGGEGDSASFDIPASPGVAGVVVLLTVTYAIGG
jgi:uncharacterized protein YggE